MLKTLFQNLREHHISKKGLKEANKLFPRSHLTSLSNGVLAASPLSDISGIVPSDGSTPSAYQEISDAWNTCFNQLFQFSDPEFAALKMFGGSKKEKKCDPAKSFRCGFSCQPKKSKSGKDIQCKNPLPGQSKNYTEFLAMQKKPQVSTPKPQQKLIELKDVKSAADKEAYAKQELEEAKTSGDKSRIQAWETELKNARNANLKATQQQMSQKQQTLFDPLAHDSDSPLLRELYKINFNEDSVDPEFAKELKCTPGKSFRCGNSCKPLATKSGKKVQCKISLSPQASSFANGLEKINGHIVLKSGVADVPVHDLSLDPRRFQYKLVHGETGSSGSLTGVKKWDSNLAGIVQVWQDPKDGNTYVVNGHNRVNLAKQLGADEVTVKYIKASSPEEARAVGALTNIAEGRGNALDAAKFFRDTGLTTADLDQKGIPLKEKIATDGLALSQLNDGLFNRVALGELPTDRAIAIGSTIKDHKQQSELVDLIEKQEKKGKKIGLDTIKELADMVKGAPSQKEEEGGLLGMMGFAPEQRSLAFEKADLQSDIKRRLSREKRLFGIVGKSHAAKDLEKAGNKINVEESKGISDAADIALRTFDQEKNYTGAVSDTLNRAAQRIGDGENAKKVKDDAYREVLDQLQKTYASGKRPSAAKPEGIHGGDDGQGSLFTEALTSPSGKAEGSYAEGRR